MRTARIYATFKPVGRYEKPDIIHSAVTYLAYNGGVEIATLYSEKAVRTWAKSEGYKIDWRCSR